MVVKVEEERKVKEKYTERGQKSEEVLQATDTEYTEEEKDLELLRDEDLKPTEATTENGVYFNNIENVMPSRTGRTITPFLRQWKEKLMKRAMARLEAEEKGQIYVRVEDVELGGEDEKLSMEETRKRWKEGDGKPQSCSQLQDEKVHLESTVSVHLKPSVSTKESEDVDSLNRLEMKPMAFQAQNNWSQSLLPQKEGIIKHIAELTEKEKYIEKVNIQLGKEENKQVKMSVTKGEVVLKKHAEKSDREEVFQIKQAKEENEDYVTKVQDDQLFRNEEPPVTVTMVRPKEDIKKREELYFKPSKESGDIEANHLENKKSDRSEKKPTSTMNRQDELRNDRSQSRLRVKEEDGSKILKRKKSGNFTRIEESELGLDDQKRVKMTISLGRWKEDIQKKQSEMRLCYKEQGCSKVTDVTKESLDDVTRKEVEPGRTDMKKVKVTGSRVKSEEAERGLSDQDKEKPRPTEATKDKLDGVIRSNNAWLKKEESEVQKTVGFMGRWKEQMDKKRAEWRIRDEETRRKVIFEWSASEASTSDSEEDLALMEKFAHNKKKRKALELESYKRKKLKKYMRAKALKERQKEIKMKARSIKEHDRETLKYSAPISKLGIKEEQKKPIEKSSGKSKRKSKFISDDSDESDSQILSKLKKKFEKVIVETSAINKKHKKRKHKKYDATSSHEEISPQPAVISNQSDAVNVELEASDVKSGALLVKPEACMSDQRVTPGKPKSILFTLNAKAVHKEADDLKDEEENNNLIVKPFKMFWKNV